MKAVLPLTVRATLRLFVLFAVLGAGLFTVSTAQAEGHPDLALNANATSPLYGEAGTVTATASLANGEPKGYNLTFRVVLPKGISYGGGSAFDPQIISNAPGTGQTTLIFSNISDLVANSKQALDFEVNHDPALWEVGDSYAIEYESFVNSDPRLVPAFDALGNALPASYTGKSAATTSSKISAIKITKSEPSREGEILRGVHDNQTIYTLKLRNNLINPTLLTTIDDYLPAGLEFLGCEGDADNTTDAPTNPGSAEEYPGSGPIEIGAVDDCHEPQLVETVQIDPDGSGPLADGVYTHVRWNTGDLAPGQELTYQYRAAVPLTENTLDWSGTEPDGFSGGQAANLDNNAVAPAGREITDEQELTNYARGEGVYQGSNGVKDVESEDSITRTAEDLVVYKSGSTESLAQGADTTWELRFRTGEYRYSENIVVTDTLPSGLCPLGPVNYTTGNDSSDTECAPTGANPSVAYTDVTENADGTFTITWDKTALDKLAHTTVNDEFVITFPTRTRSHYQQEFLPTTPILAKDGVENKVGLTGDAFSRCATPGEPDCSVTGPVIYSDAGQPEKVVDASSAGESAPSVVLNKEVAQNDSNATDCAAATYVSEVPKYHPGDQVCWRLTIDFPAKVDTKELRVSDFLPRNATYVPGSFQNTSANTTNNTIDDSMSADGVLFWDINGTYVPEGGQKFQVLIKTETRPTGIIKPVDIEGNLLKFAIQNTPGQAFPLRDQADFETDLPAVTIAKGVKQVNSGPVNNPPIDNVTVKGSDLVTYQIDLKSTSDTKDVEVWDQLPAKFDCSMVSVISDSGVCVDGGSGVDRIKWTVPSIDDGATKALTYKVSIPGTFGPENNYINKAGVREYEADTNIGTRYVYTPQDNIDPNNPRTPNVTPIDDESNVRTPNVGMAKTRTTSISETGNSATSQATIGEVINYTVTATLPAGTTFGTNAKITDTPDSATTQPIVGTPTAQLNGAALPAGWSISTVGQTITVNIPDNYVVPASGNHVVTILLSTRVTDVAANTLGQNRTNKAVITWKDSTTRSREASVSTKIVEPKISQTKQNSVNPNSALPGDVVTYTLTTSNANTSNVSIAHDTVIKDIVPAGVTLVDANNNPLADGAIVPGTGNSIWNAGNRTITSPVVNINPGASVVWSYKATIDKPAIAGSQFKNTAEARTTSIDGTDANERTSTSPSHAGYLATSESIVKVGGATVTKSVTPEWVTIGSPMTYTVKLTIPKDLNFFNLTAADVLPDSLDFDGYIASSCISGCSATNPAPNVQTYNSKIVAGLTNIGWDLGKVDAGTADRVIQFTYKAHVRETHRNGGAKVLNGQNIVNSVHAESNLTHKWSFDPNNLHPPASYDYVSPEAKTTTPVREPKLTLDKKVKLNSGSFVDGPAQSQAGDNLTYSIVVRNTGTSNAYDVTVNDMPDVELTDIVLVDGANFNTEPWTAADRSMTWQIPGPIAPGGSFTLTYTAKALSSADLHTGDSAVNTAGSDYFGLPESDRTNGWDYREYNSNDDSVRIDFEFPEISVDKTTTASGFPDIADANVEQPFGWRIVVKNNASVAKALDTVVRDTLPPFWTYNPGSTSISGATTAEPSVATAATGDVLTWNFSGQTIQPGASVTITFTATPQLGARANPPVQTNDAEADSKDSSGGSGNADGPYTDEDDAQATLKFPIADLVLTKSAPAEVGSHEEFDYTIKVKNKGPNKATGVKITDPLPAGLVFVSSADCTSAVPSVCELGTINAGASKTVTIRVKTTYAIAGTTIVNTAVTTQKEWEPTPEDNTDTVETKVLGEANVEITKTAAPSDARPGDVVTYTLKAKNIGTAIAKNVVITDSLPVGLSFVSADAPCVEATGTVTCAIGALDPGQEKTYTVRVKVDAWGSVNTSADHLLDVQKVEAQIDLEAGQQRTVSVTCPSGYFASDGSVRIDHIDQGTGDWTAPQVLESRASSLDTWKGTVKNTATGRAQAKIFAVCIEKKTVDGDHSHDLIVSDPITVSHEVLPGKREVILPCGPGQIAIQPGFESTAPADLVYSEPEGNGWKFVLDVKQPAAVTFSIRCLTRQVSLTNGHTHDLKLTHIKSEVTIQPGDVNEAQLICADGSKGIVADLDLDEGLVSLGNDPRPVTRAFKIYNPTDHALKARISLFCLGLRTGGEHLPPKKIVNTAMISTTSDETQTGNNSSSATIIAEDTNNHTPVPDDPNPDKPVINNPVATTIVGKGVSYSVRRGVIARIKCSDACNGVAKLVSNKRIKVGGKLFRKGTVLARSGYRLEGAGTKTIRLKVNRKGKKVLKKSRKALLKLSNGTIKFMRVHSR